LKNNYFLPFFLLDIFLGGNKTRNKFSSSVCSKLANEFGFNQKKVEKGKGKREKGKGKSGEKKKQFY
jgi:hypothetical protein